MILVAGATGQLGGLITRRLLDEGRAVRMLVREGSAWQDLEAAGAQIAFGDLKDRASLDRACAGVGVVVTTANSALRGGADNTQSVERARVHDPGGGRIHGCLAFDDPPRIRARRAAGHDRR